MNSFHFSPQAYEEVQGFLRLSLPTTVFSDLAKALDAKYEAVNKLSSLLKDLTAGKWRINHTIVCNIADLHVWYDLITTSITQCVISSSLQSHKFVSKMDLEQINLNHPETKGL